MKMQPLSWNNPRATTPDVFYGERGWMLRIKPRLRRRDKNVLDMPLYRSPVTEIAGEMTIFRQLSSQHIGYLERKVVRYRRLDFLAVFRATFALFSFGLGFGVELVRIVSAFEDSPSDSSYASRSQSVMGASTSSRCLI